MENNGNNGNNGNNNNYNVVNNNYYAEEYNINREPEPEPQREPEPMNSEVLPIAMQSNMVRMLYELRVPLYALGALAGGGGGAYDDDDAEQQAIEVLARSLYDIRPVKCVIDVGEDGESGKKHGIREMTYDPETAEELKINTACGIWQEEFEKGQVIKVLPCSHAFQADAITKWLTTEKAECPICRFKLESKEVIVHPSAGEDDMPRLMSDDSDSDTDNEDDDVAIHPHSQSQPQPQAVNEQRAMENNIMYRQNNNIYYHAHGGGAADMGREYYYGVSAPMNRLLQMRTGLINGARAGGGAAHALPQRQPMQPSHAYQAPQPQPNNRIMHINNINNYFISPANNNINQEQADIEEAIRRSLE